MSNFRSSCAVFEHGAPAHRDTLCSKRWPPHKKNFHRGKKICVTPLLKKRYAFCGCASRTVKRTSVLRKKRTVYVQLQCITASKYEKMCFTKNGEVTCPYLKRMNNFFEKLRLFSVPAFWGTAHRELWNGHRSFEEKRTVYLHLWCITARK